MKVKSYVDYIDLNSFNMQDYKGIIPKSLKELL